MWIIASFVLSFNSVHYVKNPGAVLEPGSIVAKLELDDPSKVTQVRLASSHNSFFLLTMRSQMECRILWKNVTVLWNSRNLLASLVHFALQCAHFGTFRPVRCAFWYISLPFSSCRTTHVKWPELRFCAGREYPTINIRFFLWISTPLISFNSSIDDEPANVFHELVGSNENLSSGGHVLT